MCFVTSVHSHLHKSHNFRSCSRRHFHLHRKPLFGQRNSKQLFSSLKNEWQWKAKLITVSILLLLRNFKFLIISEHDKTVGSLFDTVCVRSFINWQITIEDWSCALPQIVQCLRNVTSNIHFPRIKPLRVGLVPIRYILFSIHSNQHQRR